MTRERWLVIILLLAILAGGLYLGRRLGAAPDANPEGSETFRTWFWSQRSIDIAVQVGLIFTGALGVAALLPPLHEESP